VAKTTAAAKKRGGAAALRAQSATVPPTPAETSGAQTPSRSNGDAEMSSRLSPGPGAGLEDDRAMSPVSTASSASEPPLAQRLKMNGLNSHTRNATPAPAPSTPTPVTPAPHSAVKAEPASGRAAPTSGTNAAGSAPTSPTRPWVRSVL
jgi:SWI/SNF-related matrix-associated actin-dependent regulator of chromatin subfamily B protein 1